MAAAQPKEGNYAFMPTPNDSITVNGIADRRRQSDGVPEAAAFAYSHPLRPSRSEPPQSTMSAWAPPEPQLASAASSVPTHVLAMGRPPDAAITHWYEQFLNAREAHQKDQKAWMEEKDLLKRDSVPSGSSNDKIFNDPNLIRTANEKLRQFSVSSSRDAAASGDMSTMQRKKSTNNSLPGTLQLPRLGSIPEDENTLHTPVNQVRVQQPEASPGRGETGEIPISLDPEKPPSPPTSASNLSPSISMNTLHAGHTPLMTRSGRDSFSSNHFPGQGVEKISGALGSSFDGVDDSLGDGDSAALDDSEDIELTSPKILPTDPKSATTDLNILCKLDQRLQDIAEDPESSPLAMDADVARTSPRSSAMGPGTNVDEQGSLADASVAEEFGGVRLKTKRSLNFGAEIGKLR